MPTLMHTPMLVALTEGLRPHAETLDCDDARGPRSLFGESVSMPRPVGNWTDCCRCLLKDAPRLAAYDGCSVLWRGEEGDASVHERARGIVSKTGAAGLSERPDDEGLSGCALDVPVRTYLAGRSSSSFALAWKLCEDGLLPEWGGVICSCQTEGRGRLRRPWHSPRGNLHVTFRLPDDPLLRGDAASVVTGFILVRALRNLGFPLSLKWPNDLLLNGRAKVGGILLEEKDGVMLAGLGLNLYEAPDANGLRENTAVPAAVLLPQTDEAAGRTDEPLAPFPLWRLLLCNSILEYGNSVAGREPGMVLEDASACLAWRQEPIRLTDAGEVPAVCLGLGPGGGILLRLENGEEREFFSGSLLPV